MGAEEAVLNATRNCIANNSTNIAEETHFSGPLMVFLGVMMGTLVVVTVAGNALVIFAFKVDKSLRRQSNYFFLNLAISDFLVGAFCIPVYIPYILSGRWMLGRGLCKLWLVMDYLLCTASVFSIVLISYDRFLSVTQAVSYRAKQGMTKHAIGKMVAVWVLAFLLYGPAILFWDQVSGRSCVPPDECFAEFYYTWYFLLSASTLEFFSPFVSVAFFNLSIYLNIRRRRRLCGCRGGCRGGGGVGGTRQPQPAAAQEVSSSSPAESVRLSSLFYRQSLLIAVKKTASPVPTTPPPTQTPATEASNQHNHQDEEKGSLDSQMSSPPVSRVGSCGGGARRSRLSRDKKVAKSLAVIVCVFAVCWAPYTLLMIIRAACKGDCVAHHWYEVTFWLLWLNSAINPFLYPVCHSSFRRAFARILCPRWRRASRHHVKPP
ncbi:histamine H3 receptor-like [Engraulis encrasicolus]|uniref:histamine H3 receptor-like n=1 Tax=Engraulis encrasicolus TaxID=184585 RepID=UPI002FD370A4